jgi:hypothetical protein
MQQITLQAIANQTLTYQADNNVYDISVQATSGVMSATILINNTPIVTGARCVSGEFIIPYAYLQIGNFFISTLNGDLPDYTKFGITQALIYVSQDEIKAV